MRLLPCGTDAVLVEADGPAQVLALADALRADPDTAEVVPGARTVLARARHRMSAEQRERLAFAADAVARTTPVPVTATSDGRRVELTVVYDGADLAATAHELGLSPDELVARHAGGDYVVAFCGFAPGFAYLTGLDERLHVARLPEPRTRVPAGAVGIAGEFSGVYPRESPGGWRLLGRTDTQLWDVDADPPALLPPGTRVRFRPA
jgi:KipI family sensor histidine kinase inhibitor